MPNRIRQATNSHCTLQHERRDATYTTPKHNVKLKYDYVFANSEPWSSCQLMHGLGGKHNTHAPTSITYHLWASLKKEVGTSAIEEKR